VSRVIVPALPGALAVLFFACGDLLEADTGAIDGGPSGMIDGATATDAGCTPKACAELVGTLDGAPGTRIVVAFDATYVVRGENLAARLVRFRGSLPARPEVLDDGEQVLGNVVDEPLGRGVYWGAVGGLRFVAHDAGGGVIAVRNEPMVSGLAFGNPAALTFTTVGPFGAGAGSIHTCQIDGLVAGVCTGPGEQFASYPTDVAFTKSSTNQRRVDLAWPTDDAGAPAVMVNGTPINEAGALTKPHWFASDDTAVYVSAAEGLFRITPGSMPPRIDPLLTTVGADRVNAVAVAENARLVLARANKLERCTVSGSTCLPELVVVLDDDINDVAVTPEHFYWVTRKGLVQRLRRE
jgi:hypothetical protein